MVITWRMCLNGGVHISVHVHESKYFFSFFLISFKALKNPLTYTLLIMYYNKSKQNDRWMTKIHRKIMSVDYTEPVNIKFSVDLKDLFHS